MDGCMDACMGGWMHGSSSPSPFLKKRTLGPKPFLNHFKTILKALKWGEIHFFPWQILLLLQQPSNVISASLFPTQSICNSTRAVLQPGRVSFLGHDSRDVCRGNGTGTRGGVQPTGIAVREQWIHLQCLCLSRETLWKNNLGAGFPSRENTFPSCRRAQERVTSRHMDNQPVSKLFSHSIRQCWFPPCAGVQKTPGCGKTEKHSMFVWT